MSCAAFQSLSISVDFDLHPQKIKLLPRDETIRSHWWGNKARNKNTTSLSFYLICIVRLRIFQRCAHLVLSARLYINTAASQLPSATDYKRKVRNKQINTIQYNIKSNCIIISSQHGYIRQRSLIGGSRPLP